MPILATKSFATALVTITFDRPLQPGVAANGNWRGVGDFVPGFRDLAFAVPLTIAGSTVSGITGTGFLPIPGPQRIGYAALPPDVISTEGVPAVAFTDFPMVTIP